MSKMAVQEMIKSECVAVVAFPIVALAEAHHFGNPFAVVDLDWFKVLEQEPLHPGDLDIEVFARAQEQAHDE